MDHVPRKHTLICTVGTSLLGARNLAGLRADDPDPIRARLASARDSEDWEGVGEALALVSPSEFLCGAEVNSLASLFAKGYAEPDARLVFCHSATPEGRQVGRALVALYRRAGHGDVQVREIADLQDKDPELFRTSGLRNLARVVCEVIREYSPAACAINATGGYKAQIAIAVMMGQALGVPVYYKHEHFDAIIAFPPMPVALDLGAWMRLSWLFDALEHEQARLVDDDMAEGIAANSEFLEGLVDRIEEDGRAYLALSPAGQIFHETLRDRFRSHRGDLLPPAVPVGRKQPVHWENSGHMKAHPEIHRFLQVVTDEVPQVVGCSTFEANPKLPGTRRFRLGSKGIVGFVADGDFGVKFRVETSATTRDEEAAVVAALNDWLATQ